MPKVDFYLLQEGPRDALLTLVCRVANKVYQSKLTGIVMVPDAECAARLDDLMWSYEQGGFLPHGRVGDGPANNPPPIVISHDQQCEYTRDVLISLLEQIPEDYTRFRRIAEVVGAGAEDKAKARDRYRLYRDQGCQLDTHEMSAQ